MSQPATPSISYRLQAGSSFGVNGSIKSPNGNYDLVLQGDGNFVVYAPAGRPLWATNTTDWPQPVTCILETDGNLRLLDQYNQESWSSGTGGQGNATSLLIIQDDGNVIITTDGKTIWSTNTSQGPSGTSTPPASSAPLPVSGLNPGATLLVGQTLQSPNGDHQLSLLASGGLQLHQVSLNSTVVYEPMPNSTTQDVKCLTLTDNLKLELLGADNTRLWRGANRKPALNQTYPPPGPDGLPELNGPAGLVIDNDCNIYIRDGMGLVLWKISDLVVSIGDSLRPGTMLDKAHCLSSTTGGYVARISTNGNLILQLRPGWDSFQPGLLWTSNVTNADSFWMSDDGSLCVGSGGNAAWSSNTGGHAGQGDIVLVVQPDGNMCIYVAGKCTFQTNTANGIPNFS
ncbi:hypothetical protein ACHAPT_012027 [Fusarium lateritium]